jgi:uncharacterized protein YbbC (DUF1343 family)
MKLPKRFQKARVGILTNQSAYINGEYIFESIRSQVDLKVIFMPEHGLFAELQDQVSGKNLRYNYGSIRLVNLYGDTEESLVAKKKELQELDLVIIAIQDVGARYYTFLTSAFYLMQSISKSNQESSKNTEVLVVDFKNPIGSKVEGTPLSKGFSSFVGVETVPHRHGLSSFALLNYYNQEFSLSLKISKLNPPSVSYWVPPSPNIPTRDTCLVYVGQCLLEGTNLSEGRGTTRPFEIFGAPYLNIQNQAFLNELNRYQKKMFYLRPLFFQPTFHKYEGQICGGFQLIILNPEKFHSLLFSLHMIRTIKEFFPKKFNFLKGVYEFRSDKPAIELLGGDEKIISFLHGKLSYLELSSYFKHQESIWKNKFLPQRN